MYLFTSQCSLPSDWGLFASLTCFFCLKFLALSQDALPPSPPLDNIRVKVIIWRLRGNIIRTALCWIVWQFMVVVVVAVLVAASIYTVSPKSGAQFVANLNFNFPPVVWQHTPGVVGYTMWLLFRIYSSFQRWKSFEKRINFDKIIAINCWSTFLGTQCTYLPFIAHLFII